MVIIRYNTQTKARQKITLDTATKLLWHHGIEGTPLEVEAHFKSGGFYSIPGDEVLYAKRSRDSGTPEAK